MSLVTWKYVSNQFNTATRTSNVKMLSIASDTKAKLEAEIADADINTFYTAYLPVYDAYRLISINYDIAEGNREGETLNIETILKEDLPFEVKKWEGVVRNVYVEDSPEEHRIFPNKRTKLLTGTYEKRIEEIGAIAGRLAEDTNVTLQAYAPTVQSFYNLAFSARNSQQMKEGTLGQLSDTREAQRVLVAQELYAVLGGLMRKFKTDPTQVERFFDLSLLRETGDEGGSEVTFSGTITDNVTGALIGGATIAADGEVIATTNALGQFSITFPITEPLTVNLTITKTGYAVVNTTQSFSPGVNETQNINMARTVLFTYQGTYNAGIFSMGNALGATGLRITLLAGSAATVGFSNTGNSFVGNTETVTIIDEVVDRTVAELGGGGAFVLVQNNSGGTVEVRVDVLG
jgi:hypothetical protein